MIKRLAKLLLTFGLLAVIVATLDRPAEVLEVLGRLTPLLLALVLGIYTLDRALMAYKWTVLLRAQGLELPLGRAIQIYCSAMLWGLFLPATMGADAVRAVATRREGLEGSKVLASIAVERLIGVIPTAALAMLGLVLLRRLGLIAGTLVPFWWGAAGLLVLAVVLLLASASDTLYVVIHDRVLGRFADRKPVQLLARLHTAFQAYGRERGALAWFLALTILEQGTAILVTWLVARGLGAPLDVTVVVAAVSVATLATRIPVSIGGIGVYEGVFILVTGAAGMPAETALSIGLFTRVAQIVTWIPWWIAYSLGRGTLRRPSPEGPGPFREGGMPG